MKKIFNKEFAIGLSVIVAILILIFGIDYLKGINLFKPANFYVVPYKNVAGLETAAPVTIQGFKVGTVREIHFNYEHPGEIDVEIAIDKNLRLPEGTKAYLENSLLGGASIALELGKSDRFIEIGGKLESAKKPDIMASVTEGLMPKVEAILPQLDSLLQNVNRIVADPAITASIHRLDAITANLEATTRALNASVGHQLPAIMGNASKATSRLDSISANLADLSYSLKTLPLNTTVDNVNEITENLSRFSRQLNDPGSSLGLLMKDPELYNRLNRVAADVDSLIVDIKKNPKRYISIKLL